MRWFPAGGAVAPTGVAGGPVYIGGLDRSGKTTMAGFLASHPSICIPGVGSNMWTYFYGQFGSLESPGNIDRCLDAMLRYKHVQYLQPDADRIRHEFANGPRTYARLFSLFLIHYAEQRGKPRWGAQTGLIERYADQVVAAYPGVRIIHMVRDPRDRYEASLARWPDGRGRAGGATARWRYSTGLAQRHADRHPGSYLVVRFEDLVVDPVSTLRRVCAFLDEPFVPEMLELGEAPTLRVRLREAGADAAPVEDDSKVAPLSPDFIGRFRGRVPPAELAFLELHARRQMRAHGYEPGEPLRGVARARFYAIDWPNQAGRMVAWRAIEELQQRFPRMVGRRPGRRMIIDEPVRVRA